MVRWRYRGNTMFLIGCLFSVLLFAAVTGFTVLGSEASSPAVGLRLLFPGALIVRHPASPPPAALMDGSAGAPARPLAAAPDCLALLAKEPAVSAVLPFSWGRAALTGDGPGESRRDVLAVGLSEAAWSDYRARLLPAPDGLPSVLSDELVLPVALAVREEASSPRCRWFLDSPESGGAFNLTAFTRAREYGIPGRKSPPSLPIAFLSEERFFRCFWRDFRDPSAAVPGRETAAGGPLPAFPFIQKKPAGAPLAYPFLFSLSSARGAGSGTPSALFPQYLLVELKADASSRPDELSREWARRFAARKLAAVIEPWNPEAVGGGGPSRLIAFALTLALALAVLVVLANALLAPVVSEARPEEEKAGDFTLARWRPTFFSRNAFIALTFGLIGVWWSLIGILVYNYLAPEGFRAAWAALFGIGIDPLKISGIGLAAAAAAIVLFMILTLPGPLLRSRRMVNRLSAVQAERPRRATPVKKP